MIKINLAKSAGFCFGVKRALTIAFNTAGGAKEVCMLGDIVHNEDVVKKIKECGIKKIEKLTSEKDKTLLIRAHGAPLTTVRKANAFGYKIVDATCPMVKEIHKIARKNEQKGYRIIVIGDKKHDEVQGIVGQLKHKAIVIDKRKNVPLAEIKSIKKACAVVQSTQNPEKAYQIVESLKRHIKELIFFNTICKPTRIKQEEIRKLPLKNDAVIIIGSKKSANARRLYEISRSLNKRSYWVNSKQEIKTRWLKGAKSVGVTAGASTPDEITRDIIDYIKKNFCSPPKATSRWQRQF